MKVLNCVKAKRTKEPSTLKASSFNRVVLPTHQSLLDRLLLDRSLPDRSLPDWLLLDRSLPDRLLFGQLGRLLPDRLLPDRLLPNRFTCCSINWQLLLDRLLPVVPDQSLPDRSLPDRSLRAAGCLATLQGSKPLAKSCSKKA